MRFKNFSRNGKLSVVLSALISLLILNSLKILPSFAKTVPGTSPYSDLYHSKVDDYEKAIHPENPQRKSIGNPKINHFYRKKINFQSETEKNLQELRYLQ
jgi:hypothetical protein